jgi:arsenate reductase (thioredoxin)
MSDDGKINVLFVCEDNAIRSIIAAALLNRFSRDRFRVFSCGHQPAREVHPRTIEMLKFNGLDSHNHHPRDLQDFLTEGAPEMDLVINLCDKPLPPMPGCPIVANWRITHPIAQAGVAKDQAVAFRRTLRELENRVRLIALLRHPTREERLRKEHELAQAA